MTLFRAVISEAKGDKGRALEDVEDDGRVVGDMTTGVLGEEGGSRGGRSRQMN
jgi:hypothetical protein